MGSEIVAGRTLVTAVKPNGETLQEAYSDEFEAFARVASLLQSGKFLEVRVEKEKH